MLPEVLSALAPQAAEVFVDATFGAGGYSKAILESADTRVIAIDRDPQALRNGAGMAAAYNNRLELIEGEFGDLADLVAGRKVDGVVLDIGVSSMQLDEAARGFSFMREGPLDMRMASSGPSAADYVNRLDAEELARIIFIFGEEPRSRVIAKAIVKAREISPLMTTFDLVRAIEKATGPQKGDRTHPATRTFQALRIHVNNELDELASALSAAEHILGEGGRLVVVTFHSLEDRIVKRFFSERSGVAPSVSRHVLAMPEVAPASFRLVSKSALQASDAESHANPRARSAKMRFGIRTKADALPLEKSALAVPQLEGRKRS